MAFGVRMKVDVVWIPDGAGGMAAPSAQVLSFFPSTVSATGLPNTGMAQFAPVPGGDSPTAANFNTAIGNIVSDIEAQIAVAATLARIQSWATTGNG